MVKTTFRNLILAGMLVITGCLADNSGTQGSPQARTEFTFESIAVSSDPVMIASGHPINLAPL